MGTLSDYARLESFRSVEKLIYHTVEKFRRHYGGNRLLLIEEAFEHYCQAYEDHDPEIAPFHTHVRYKVWIGLLSTVRRNAKRNARMRGHSLDGFSLEAKQAFSVDKVFGDLSPDAQFLGKLVLEPPGGLVKKLRPVSNGISEGRSFRKGLKTFLRDLGWSLDRITETFQEIKEALA